MDEAINYDGTRWAKTVLWMEPRQLVVDNWGTMSLDGRGPDNREPTWAWIPGPTDSVPDIIRVPDHATEFNYMDPPTPPIYILPPDDITEPKTHHRALHPYRFGHVQIMACFAPEINAWCIGRISTAP